jgi:hypothetical protein
MRLGGGLKHEDPLGAGHPAVLVPPRDRIPGDPLRTPVPTLVRLRLGAGRTPALLMQRHDHNMGRAGLVTTRRDTVCCWEELVALEVVQRTYESCA